MSIEEIEIVIKPDGEVSYEVRGIKGKGCLDLTKDLERDLGGRIVFRSETSEMCEAPEERESVSASRSREGARVRGK